jgi:hypothetical protein
MEGEYMGPVVFFMASYLKFTFIKKEVILALAFQIHRTRAAGQAL